MEIERKERKQFRKVEIINSTYLKKENQIKGDAANKHIMDL